MADTLFDGNDLPPTIDPNKKYLEDLVGEGKKFKTQEDLARGKYEADQYVEHLKSRLDELRTDYTKLQTDYNARAKLEELLDQSVNSKLPKDEVNTQTNIPEKSYDPKEIESLVSQKILENENSKKQQENYNQVRTKLKERYGERYAAILKEQTENLGLSEEFVNNLARNHPSVLFKTLGIDQVPETNRFQSPPRSNTRSDSFKPSVEKRTWAYYQRMKKDNPALYRDPQTHVQMWKDQVELGNDFEDGDFHTR